jgi:thiol-disulfide isomerase/thioredoxin
VLCDTPANETWPRCKLEVFKQGGVSGWVLRDSRGVTVRKLIDTNGDNVVNQRSFYLNGQEVYRDVDTNRNGKVDTYRWFNAGGSRWGVSSNEDGKIDQWKTISAEEATAEAVAALATRDFARFQAVLLTEADLKELGLDEKTSARVTAELGKASSEFQKLTASISPEIKWTRFDGHNPISVPGGDAGAAKDLVLYHNGTVIAEADGKSVWLRAPEVVRFGDVWKLTTVPVIIDEKKQVDAAGLLVPAIDQVAIAAEGNGDTPVENNENVQKLVAELQKHDEQMPQGGSAQVMIAYHIKRHSLCANIGKNSSKLANREHWYKQAADSLDAAVQTKEYPEGIEYLERYSQNFAKTSWGGNLAAYFKYRAINADYAVRIDKDEHSKAQEKYLADLSEFIKTYPKSEDSADALWQLGNGMEFANKDHESLGYYKSLMKDHPKSQFAKKAEGAVRRLEGVGQVCQLTGTDVYGSPVDTAQLRGKVLVVHYWATWCEPCKAELPRLAALREKFGRQGLELVGVNLDTDANAASGFVRQRGIEWPQMQEKGALDGELAVKYGIISLPTMMLIDEDGKILNRNLQANQMEIEVEKAVAKKIASRGN